MMGWIAIVVLAAIAFAIAAFALRLPREGWVMFGAVLLFGLAGYAWLGSPSQPGSPTLQQAKEPRLNGEEMVEARSALFDELGAKPDYLMLSDGFARRGRFGEAATLLRSGLRDNPDHLEGWLALGMSLVGHSDGFVTPAASYAYSRARQIAPENPAADYFLGFSYLQSGEIVAARNVWQGLLERSPQDAPWREELEGRVAQLDDMIARAPMLQGQ